MLILIVIVVLICLTGAAFIYVFRDEAWDREQAAYFATVIEAAAVVGALIFAAIQYQLQFSADEGRKKEAVTSILLRSFHPRYVDEAFGNLYRKYDQEGASGTSDARSDDKTFDDDTGSLLSYFSTVATCIGADLCDKQLSYRIFCADYMKYRAAFLRIHGGERARQRLIDDVEMKPLEECPGIKSAK